MFNSNETLFNDILHVWWTLYMIGPVFARDFVPLTYGDKILYIDIPVLYGS